MKATDIPELQDLTKDKRVQVLSAVVPTVFKDPRVWGAYVAQIIGFILIFFVLMPTAQPRLLLILAYAIPTMLLVNRIHKAVTRERVIEFLKSERAA